MRFRDSMRLLIKSSFLCGPHTTEKSSMTIRPLPWVWKKPLGVELHMQRDIIAAGMILGLTIAFEFMSLLNLTVS